MFLFLESYLFQIIGAVEIGLIYGFVAIGVYLTFRVMDFPDLSADGTFPLGAALSAFSLSTGIEPFTALMISIAGGSLAGAFTGWLHVRWGILNLLSGILTMTALYSINIRIMGRPNMSLDEEKTIFSYFPSMDPWILILLLLMVTFFVFLLFMHSKAGIALRALGSNKKMAVSQGVPFGRITILGLCISNGLIAMGGALFAQQAAFADVSLGVGTIIFGLASVIIGQVIIPSSRLALSIFACIIGSVVYRLFVAGALNMTSIGMEASDLNLITAAIVALAMIIPKVNLKKTSLAI
jgi:putative ABC transport system permease protein